MGVVTIAPSFPPLQLTSVTLKVALIAGITVILTFATSVQPEGSEIVSVTFFVPEVAQV